MPFMTLKVKILAPWSPYYNDKLCSLCSLDEND